jgi:hypothetical protein
MHQPIAVIADPARTAAIIQVPLSGTGETPYPARPSRPFARESFPRVHPEPDQGELRPLAGLAAADFGGDSAALGPDNVSTTSLQAGRESPAEELIRMYPHSRWRMIRPTRPTWKSSTRSD